MINEIKPSAYHPFLLEVYDVAHDASNRPVARKAKVKCKWMVIDMGQSPRDLSEKRRLLKTAYSDQRPMRIRQNDKYTATAEMVQQAKDNLRAFTGI